MSKARSFYAPRLQRLIEPRYFIGCKGSVAKCASRRTALSFKNLLPARCCANLPGTQRLVVYQRQRAGLPTPACWSTNASLLVYQRQFAGLPTPVFRPTIARLFPSDFGCFSRKEPWILMLPFYTKTRTATPMRAACQPSPAGKVRQSLYSQGIPL